MGIAIPKIAGKVILAHPLPQVNRFFQKFQRNVAHPMGECYNIRENGKQRGTKYEDHGHRLRRRAHRDRDLGCTGDADGHDHGHPQLERRQNGAGDRAPCAGKRRGADRDGLPAQYGRHGGAARGSLPRICGKAGGTSGRKNRLMG